MDIGGAELSIFSMTLITIVRLYYFSIANFKALSIYISISYSWTFEDTIAEPRDYCESLCTGTYFIAFIADILWILLLVILRSLVM